MTLEVVHWHKKTGTGIRHQIYGDSMYQGPKVLLQANCYYSSCRNGYWWASNCTTRMQCCLTVVQIKLTPHLQSIVT